EGEWGGRVVSGANAYLDGFLEQKKDLVPWGYPCNRTEGGAHTGNGSPTDSCDVGVPSGVNIANRRFVVDPTIGSIVVFCTFGAGNGVGGSGAPDTHLFRVENGKLRYVHTLTHLLQADFRRGRGRPEERRRTVDYGRHAHARPGAHGDSGDLRRHPGDRRRRPRDHRRSRPSAGRDSSAGMADLRPRSGWNALLAADGNQHDECRKAGEGGGLHLSAAPGRARWRRPDRRI